MSGFGSGRRDDFRDRGRGGGAGGGGGRDRIGGAREQHRGNNAAAGRDNRSQDRRNEASAPRKYVDHRPSPASIAAAPSATVEDIEIIEEHPIQKADHRTSNSATNQQSNKSVPPATTNSAKGPMGGGSAHQQRSGGRFDNQHNHQSTNNKQMIHASGNSGAQNSSDKDKKKQAGGKCRLFVGCINQDVKEDEVRKLFEQYGTASECFVSSRGFGFVRMASRAQAETAKEKLDGHMLKGRQLKIRFAVHGASLKVKELSPYVSNELLEEAFGIFGSVERAIHICDDKGRPTGEGIVEFERKTSAVDAIRRINDNVFLLTISPHPIHVEALEQKDDEDGLADRMIPATASKNKEREQGPRFARDGTFEFDFGRRWQELYKMEKVRRDQLDHEFREARERVEADMDLAYQEYQAQQMREELRRRQQELEQLEAQRRDRMEVMRKRDEEMLARRQQSQGPGGMHQYNQPPFGRPSLSHAPPTYEQDAPFNMPPQQRGPGGEFDVSQQPPPIRSHQGGRGGDAPGGRGRRDEHLVSGVQKLLQMFKGDDQGANAQQQQEQMLRQQQQEAAERELMNRAQQQEIAAQQHGQGAPPNMMQDPNAAFGGFGGPPQQQPQFGGAGPGGFMGDPNAGPMFFDGMQQQPAPFGLPHEQMMGGPGQPPNDFGGPNKRARRF